jgi:ubiquinone/menaquinone biosynthesis C-methylase UbiE
MRQVQPRSTALIMARSVQSVHRATSLSRVRDVCNTAALDYHSQLPRRGARMHTEELKQRVKDHWERETCGSRYGDATDRKSYFDQIDAERYVQEYMLPDFAAFHAAKGQRVLEVGLGTGSDFIRWVRAGADAYGRDLTEASVKLVKERLSLEGLEADVQTGDAEKLDFPDNHFDGYYSWGVLHHTPEPEKAFAEAYRVLKPGGTLKVMLYHWPSVGAALVWLVHGPLKGKFRGPRAVNYDNVESPGTKIYSVREATEMIGRYFDPRKMESRTYLGAGDLLPQNHRFSAKYQGLKWRVAKSLYPRWFVKNVLGDRFGTAMTIRAVK